MPSDVSSGRNIRRVLLIRPHLTIETYEAKSLSCPLGIGYLAAVLEKESYNVMVLDCLAEGFDNETRGGGFLTYGLSLEDSKMRIRSFGPDLVGVSCLFSMQFNDALGVCRAVKEVNKDIVTVMGGSHPSVAPAEVLNDPAVDFVIIGEGEISIIALLGALKKGSGFSGVDGLGYKEGGKIAINPKMSYVNELDRIPFPARHLLPMEVYFKRNRPHGIMTRHSLNTNMITSRGCPGGCIFCSIHSVFGRNFRARSPENVLLEIEILKKDYGIREIQFEDDNLTFNKERASKILKEIIERRYDISWTAPNGVALWALDVELIRLMKESGCWHCAVAIESGDQQVLSKIIKKPLRLDKVMPLVKEMSRLKIGTTAFFVIGFPGEKLKQIRNTLKYALSLPVDDVGIYFATPYPGTELYKISCENGLIKKDWNLRNLKVSGATIQPEEVSMRQLERMVSETVILFRLKNIFLRPHIFIFRWLIRFAKEPLGAFRRVSRLLRKILNKP